MRRPELCIERPVLTTVMSLSIVLVGAIALLRLPNRELPGVDPPVVAVTTVYPFFLSISLIRWVSVAESSTINTFLMAI